MTDRAQAIAADAGKLADDLRKSTGVITAYDGVRLAELVQRAVMPDTLTKYPRAWCPNCKAIQPAKLIPMSDTNNDHDAADLICTVCYTIIATLHA
jgi:hypothetical protein